MSLDSDKLRFLADWFDKWDTTPYEERQTLLDARGDDKEVQRDLRRMADDLEDLSAIWLWYDTTHGREMDHDHHCPIPTNGTKPKKGVKCSCGWAEAEKAFTRHE